MFVLYFACIAVPSNPKLEKDQPIQTGRLNEAEVGGLNTLLHRLLSPPILSLSGLDKRSKLGTDVYDK